MVAQGYRTEQAIYASLVAVTFAVQVLQLWAQALLPLQETRRDGISIKRRPVGHLKQVFHFLGPMTTALLIARSVDPRGALNILGYVALTFLANNTTALLLCAASAALFLTVRSAYRISSTMNRTAGPSYLLGVIIATAVVSVLLANVQGALIAVREQPPDRVYLYGVWILYVAGILFFNFACFNYGVHQLTREVVNASNAFATGNSRDVSQQAGLQALQSLKQLQILGNVIAVISIGFQTALGIHIVTESEEERSRLYLPDPNDYKFEIHEVFSLLIICALWLMIYHSWIPLPRTRSSRIYSQLASTYSPSPGSPSPGSPISESRTYNAPPLSPSGSEHAVY